MIPISAVNDNIDAIFSAVANLDERKENNRKNKVKENNTGNSDLFLKKKGNLSFIMDTYF
jgi:hypothetical protein